jgi:hypothetical protein
MAKPVSLTADDLTPPPDKPRQTTPARQTTAMRQRGVTASSQTIPLQFRLPPDFVKTFKQAALDRDMKLNELLIYCFHEFMKKNREGQGT